MTLTADEAILAYARRFYPTAATARIEMEVDEGFPCCGGSDPNCYCSMAVGPSQELVLTGYSDDGFFRKVLGDGDMFVTILEVLLEIGGLNAD